MAALASHAGQHALEQVEGGLHTLLGLGVDGRGHRVHDGLARVDVQPSQAALRSRVGIGDLVHLDEAREDLVADLLVAVAKDPQRLVVRHLPGRGVAGAQPLEARHRAREVLGALRHDRRPPGPAAGGHERDAVSGPRFAAQERVDRLARRLSADHGEVRIVEDDDQRAARPRGT